MRGAKDAAESRLSAWLRRVPELDQEGETAGIPGNSVKEGGVASFRDLSIMKA